MNKLEGKANPPNKKNKPIKLRVDAKNVNRDGVRANQYVVDPRAALAWKYYVSRTSPTWSNALRSALKAGYSKTHAVQITSEGWWRERARRMNLLDKSEKVLEEMLDLPVKVIKLNKRSLNIGDEDDEEGERTDMVVQTDPALVKIKQDTAKFVSERLGKSSEPGEDMSYSTRNEVTGAGGKSFIPNEEAEALSHDAIAVYLNARKQKNS